ncbi:MAG: glycosyltransferase family 39 protein [Syntrophaceae bacterium]|nr:glycosyltransferase family 39 protein [Syntrophaceae bacterium]
MKTKLLFLLVVPLFLYIILLPAMPLMEPSEARYSHIASLMNSTGDYVTPHLQHVVFLEKPPLCCWATALSFKIFGENDFSSRLFVGLCAWGCIILVYFIGVFFSNEKTGLYSAGVLSTFLFHFAFGRINILDIPLAFFVCLAIWTGYRYIEKRGRGKTWLYLFYFSSALAFLTKGLIGIVFPFAILILWLLISRRWRDVFMLFSPVGIIILLAVSCPWIILAQKANQDFLWFFFIREHFLRFATDASDREGPFFYFIPIIIAGTLPWCAFLIEATTGDTNRKNRIQENLDLRFLLTWIVFILVFFSVSSSKLIPYITPLFLPLAVIFGYIFSLYDDRGEALIGRRKLLLLPVALQSMLFIVTLVILPILKNIKLGGDLVIMYSEKWWFLIIPPIVFQIMIIFLPNFIKLKWKKGWFMTIYILSALFLTSMVFPASDLLTPYRSSYPVSQAIKLVIPADEELFQYGINLYGIDFYNKIRTPIVDDIGELRYGINRLQPAERSRYFLSPKDFFKLCKEKGGIYCVTKYKERLDRLKKYVSNVEVLWSNGAFYLLKLDCCKMRG